MPSQPRDAEKRGGHAAPATEKDRPEQNVGYDEAVKGASLDEEEREEAVAESPLTPDDPNNSDGDARGQRRDTLDRRTT